MKRALALAAALLTFAACYLLTWAVGQPEVLFFGLFLPAVAYSGVMEK